MSDARPKFLSRKVLLRPYHSLRRLIWTTRVRLQAGSVGQGLKVNHKSSVTARTVLGDFVNFNGMRIGGGGAVTVGSYFHSGRGCVIMTTFHNYDGGSRIPYGPVEEDVHKDVEIGDCVWLGDGCTILAGVKIGEGAVIQAGSVVVSDIPALAVAGGHPARVFRQRDAEHYFALKAAGRFH